MDFVQVSTEFVSSRGQPNHAEFSFNLSRVYHNVVGIEVSAVHIPLHATNAIAAGANLIDFRVRHADFTNGAWQTLTAELPRDYDGGLKSLPQNLADALNVAVLFDPVVSDNFSFGARSTARGGLELNLSSRSTRSLTAGEAEVELLFGSGTNAAQSAAEPLGFDAQDTILDASVSADPQRAGGSIWRGVVASDPVQLERSSYLDIRLAQAPRLRPLARVFLESSESDRLWLQEIRQPRGRVLKEPLRVLSRLDLSLHTDRNQAAVVHDPVFLTLRIAHLGDSPLQLLKAARSAHL